MNWWLSDLGARDAVPLAALVAIWLVVVPGRSDAQGSERTGQEQFQISCGTCHVADPNGGPRQGPNLFGVFGRRAGTLPGYDYSPALAHSDLVWNDDTLDKWITNAQVFVPGVRMPYHQADPTKRKLVIDYLKSLNNSK